MNIYSITETSVSPHGNFISTTIVHVDTNRELAVKEFDKIVDRELPKSKSTLDQPHRTIFIQGGGSKLIVNFHCNKTADRVVCDNLPALLRRQAD